MISRLRVGRRSDMGGQGQHFGGHGRSDLQTLLPTDATSHGDTLQANLIARSDCNRDEWALKKTKYKKGHLEID